MFDNNKIAIIDLDASKTDFIDIPEEIRRKFLGGRGINMFLLYHLTSKTTDPLSPENPLIVGAGLLSGLTVPAASRCSISGKSPETGLLGDSSIGGHFAAVLRQTGFDHLIIKGRSEIPVYLFLEDGRVEIKDASGLWGMDTIGCMQYLENLYGSSSESLCIGQAGENLVRFAGVRHGQKRMAGRTGMGCLMGSKKIKAIVVKGQVRTGQKTSKALTDYVRGLNSNLRRSRTSVALHRYGTPFLYDLHNHTGVIRTRNGQETRFEEGRYLRAANLKKRYYKNTKACFSCPIACSHTYEIMDGKGKGLQSEGPEFGMLAAFGPVCGIKDPEVILVINDILNRYGMDCSSAGNIIAWATELFQRGIIDEKDTCGLSLDWGDEEVIISLINQIVCREGFGALLADGAKAASGRIGRGSERYLIWSKNLPQSDSVDVRAYKGFALGVATASRGADHLRSRPTIEALNLSEGTISRILGDKDVSSDPASYIGKPRMVWWSEINYAIADALGICRFAQKFNNIDHLGISEFSRLILYSTGMSLSQEDLFKIGERIVTLERMFLKREGLDRTCDTLPARYFDEPLPSGRYKGELIDRDRFNKMLDDYYSLHNWEIETGMPSEETIKGLGLDTNMDSLLNIGDVCCIMPKVL
ncbi:aldehyde ferredoxin oxidoreductase family protein [bacterium]|nr:aldehyde ferredoxin oxidoreductase family protein [bacterium]